MKKILIITCSLLLALGSFAQQPRSFKRGVGTNNMAYRANYEVLAPGVSWFYNWSSSAPALIADDWETLGMDYIPMVWGGGLDNENGRNRVRDYIRRHPSVKYLLGYNEPNFTSQSRMTPQYAASQWTYMEQIADEFGLTLVGPALNFGPAGGSVRDPEDNHEYTDPFDWYDKFFALCPDCRVDHIAIHLYMPAGAMKGTINKFWDKYRRPVWLTEFNRNDGGSSTPEDHMRFLTTELEMLEKHPHVFRYAWFMTYSSVWQINLLDLGEGRLTDLGRLYTGMSSFDSTYFHPVGLTIPAAHYQSAQSLTLVPSTADPDLLMLKDMSTGSWAEYLVDIPRSGSYSLNLHLACKSGSKIEVYEDDALVTTITPQATASTDFDHWAEQSFPVTLTAGHHRLRLLSKARLYYYDRLRLDYPDAIDSAESAKSGGAEKSLRDGQLLISTPSGTYNSLGQRITEK